jgi:hypothetical protein
MKEFGIRLIGVEMDEADRIVEDLILNGAMEVAAIDIDNGEILYNFTDKLRSVNPELYQSFFTYFYTDVMALWEHGFVDISLEDQDPSVRLTDKAIEMVELNELNKEEQSTLKEIVRIISEKQ